MSGFIAQDLANIAWAFAIAGQLDTTMVRVLSQEVFEWLRGYQATRQILEGLPSDVVMHVNSVLWAFSFARVLEPEFAGSVQDMLQNGSCETDRSRLGSQKMLRFHQGSHSGPVELYVELDVADMMVISKCPDWEVDMLDEVTVGDVH